MADSSILTLTPAENTKAKLVLYTTPVGSAQGLSISFNFYAYGGTGGDGIGFLLLNGSKLPSSPGGFGGSLGYAPLLNVNQPGIEGAYLGIGFDEFGNFSASTGGERSDGPGRRPDSIAVRGSQAAGYKYLTGTESLTIPGTDTPFSLDNPEPTATRESSKRTAKIDLSPQGQLTVSLDFNSDGDVVDPGEQLFSLNVIASENGSLPETFAFGFAASTGGATNIHEVGNFQVNTFSGTPIPGNFTDGVIIFANSGSDSGSGSGSGSNPDPITGSNGADIIVGSSDKDVSVGGQGADRFVFSGVDKPSALRSSTLRNLDRINDFNQQEGDRIQLDFDRTLSTVELPRRVFNAGTLKGSLLKATRQAYADKDFKKKGKQVLKPNEAVFFRLGRRTYISVNDDRRAFSEQNDLLVDVSGIRFKGGDLNRGTLVTNNYFA